MTPDQIIAQAQAVCDRYAAIAEKQAIETAKAHEASTQAAQQAEQNPSEENQSTAQAKAQAASQAQAALLAAQRTAKAYADQLAKVTEAQNRIKQAQAAQQAAQQQAAQQAAQQQAAQQTPPTDAEAPLQEAALLGRVRRLTFARDLTREFVQSTGSMKKVMDVIFSRVLEVLEAEAGSMWLTDERLEQNICHLAEGPAKKQVVGLRLPLGKGIVGQVIASNKSDVVLDCTQDSRFDAQVDQRSGFRTQSMICVPLSDQGDAFGAIQIINKSSGFQKQFTEDDQRLVEDLSLSASIAVRNARLLESESRVKEMNVLMEISRQVVSTLDLDQVLALIVTRMNELAEVSNAAIALIDENSGKLFLAALSDGEQVNPEDEGQQQLLALMEQIRTAKRNLYIPDGATYRKQTGDNKNPWADYLEENELASLWASPLADEEDALGVIWTDSEEVNFAAGSKGDMLYILATQATVALRNASLFQRIPFGDVLGKMGEKSRVLVTGWRRWALIGAAVVALVAGLHFLPVFRSVSGECTVEARFGRGVYLPVEGRVEQVYVKEGDRVKQGDLLLRLDEKNIHLRLVQAEAKLAILERQIVETKAAGDASAMGRANVERVAALAEVTKAREDLAKVAVRAAENGIILTARPEELLGRDFGIGSEVLRIGDPDNFTIVMELPEEDLLDIKKGLKVRGVLRSRPGKGFTGHVRHVGRAFSIPSEALEAGVAEAKAPEGFVAEIVIEKSDVTLLPGMTGQAMVSTPDTSLVTRAWRRIKNAIVFWLGW